MLLVASCLTHSLLVILYRLLGVLLSAFLLTRLVRHWKRQRNVRRILQKIPGPCDRFSLLFTARYFLHSLSLNPRRAGRTVGKWLSAIPFHGIDLLLFFLRARLGWNDRVSTCPVSNHFQINSRFLSGHNQS